MALVLMVRESNNLLKLGSDHVLKAEGINKERIRTLSPPLELTLRCFVQAAISTVPDSAQTPPMF